MCEQRENGENSTEESMSSASSGEVNEQLLTLFKSFSRIIQSITYSLAYFTISVYTLNKISHRYFPNHNLNFRWNIYELLKK